MNPIQRRRHRSISLTRAGFDADAQALFEAIEAEEGAYLPESEKLATDALFKALKGASVDFYTDYIGAGYLYLGGVANAGVLEMKLTFNGTPNGNLALNKSWNRYGVSGEGISGDYIASGYNPVAEGVTVDDTGVIFSAPADPNISGTFACFGCIDGGGRRFWHYNTSGDTQTIDIGSAGGLQELSDGCSFGLYIASSHPTDNKRLNRDGVEIASEANSALLPNLEIYLMGNNNNGVDNRNYNGSGRLTIFLKKGLTDAQMIEISGIFNTWLIAMGRYVAPDLYTGFAAMSDLDNKFIEAYSIAASEAGLTTSIVAKLRALVALHKGGTDGVVNLVNPGTFNTTLVNSPLMQVDGMVGDSSPDTYGNSNLSVNDFTDERNMFALIYLQLDSSGGSILGYVDTAPNALLFSASGGGDIDYYFGGSSSTLYDAGAAIKGVIGFNCYDRGTGRKIRAFTEDGFVGVEGTIAAISSASDIFVGKSNQIGASASDNIYSQYIFGEGLTDAEAIIVKNFSSLAMKYCGISATDAVDGVNTETRNYLRSILEDSSVTLGMQEARAKNKLITELVNSGDWAEIDSIQAYGTIEQSDANLVHDLKLGISLGGSIVNTVTRDIEGAKGNGVDSYIINGFKNNAGANYAATDNSHHYDIIQEGGNLTYIHGQSAASSASRVWAQNRTSSFRTTASGTNNVEWNTAIANQKGIISTVRVNATTINLYQNGILVATTSSITDSSTSGLSHYVLIYNLNGTPTAPSAGKVGLFIFGSSAISPTRINTIFTNYKLRIKGFEIPLAA